MSNVKLGEPAVELSCFFFNDTTTTEIYTLSLHDALPIYLGENLTDLAEYIFSEGDIEPADIAVISGDRRVKKSYKPYDNKAIGVISTAPAAIFGSGKGDVKLAISGRVPVNAVNENGAIEPGDLLTTSSTAGHAMKCSDYINCFGNIIGKALTPLDKEEGEVIMIVMLN